MKWMTRIIAIALFLSCQKADVRTPAVAAGRQEKPKVTFIELGSVNCIPCRMMQPVMKAIEGKYGEQVRVVFYDVWTQAHEAYGRQYAIRLIPTQVFLDENGIEFFRHEGFFPEEEIDRLLQNRGLTVGSASHAR